MSGIFSGAIAAGLLGTVAMVTAAYDGPAPASMLRGSVSASQSFRLQVAGNAQSCLLERGIVDPRGDALVALKAGCATSHPRLANVRFWSEGSDGTMAFKGGDGAVLMEFSVADGAAYESFQPGAPLASLIALN